MHIYFFTSNYFKGTTTWKSLVRPGSPWHYDSEVLGEWCEHLYDHDIFICFEVGAGTANQTLATFLNT